MLTHLIYFFSAVPKMMSPYRMRSAQKKQAPFQPIEFDCCIAGCYLFNNEEELQCPYCEEERFEQDGLTARKVHKQLPIGPQLASFIQSKQMREKLYSFQPEKETGELKTIFDGRLFNELKNQGLFKNKYDLGISLCMDGFVAFNKKGSKLISIMIQVLNLDETER